jgi:hypothetical protein
MADDDLFGFFNELKEVKAPEEEAGPNAGEGEAPEHQDGRHLGSTILNASGKRGRGEFCFPLQEQGGLKRRPKT